MQWSTKQTCFRYGTYLGGFLLFCPIGVPWIYGNMAIYTDSFLRATLGPDSGFDTPWTMSAFVILWAGGAMLSGLLTTFKKPQLILFTGCISNIAGFFLSSLSVQTSVGLFILTMGIMPGLAIGFLYGQIVNIVAETTTPRRVGTVSGAVSSGMLAGAFVINQMITFYVNPRNFSPDLTIGTKAFFTQKEILERVPSMFLVLGGLSCSFLFIGLLLVSKRPENMTEQNMNDVELVSTTSPTTAKENNTLANTSLTEATTLVGTTGGQRYSQNTLDITGQVTRGTLKDTRSDGALAKTNLTAEKNEKHSSNSSHREISSRPEDVAKRSLSTDVLSSEKNYSTLEMLKTHSFYVVWLDIFCADLAYITYINFYKAYGQVRIQDDFFLTGIGLATNIAGILSRVVWGSMFDFLPVKTTLIIYLSSLAVMNSFWYFVPILTKWLYMVWSVLLGSINIGLYVVASLTVYKLYGVACFASNFGALLSATLILNLAGPALINALYSNFGWFGLFCSVGLIQLIALLVTVLLLPTMLASSS